MSTITDEMWKRDEAHIREAMAKQTASAEPAPETAGPVSALAVATGSLPVSSAEAIADLWEREAMEWGEKGNAAAESRDYSACVACKTREEVLMRCADHVRRQIDAATVRQPEENIEGQPTRKD